MKQPLLKYLLLMVSILAVSTTLHAAPYLDGPPYKSPFVYQGSTVYVVTIGLDPGYTAIDPYTQSGPLGTYHGYAGLYGVTPILVSQNPPGNYLDGPSSRSANYCSITVQAPAGSGTKIATFQVFEQGPAGTNATITTISTPLTF